MAIYAQMCIYMQLDWLLYAIILLFEIFSNVAAYLQ